MPYVSTPESLGEAAWLLFRSERTTSAITGVVAWEMIRHALGSTHAGRIEPFGLCSDDAGDVVAACTVPGWLIAAGAPDPAPAQVPAVRARIAPELAEDPDLADKTVRASLAEALKLYFVVLHAG